jgi:hypothetical protein
MTRADTEMAVKSLGKMNKRAFPGLIDGAGVVALPLTGFRIWYYQNGTMSLARPMGTGATAERGRQGGWTWRRR